MTVFDLSKRYSEVFSYLDVLRTQRVYIELNSPLDLPSLVARNYLLKEYYALRLAKTCVTLNGVAHIESRPPPLSTIYLFGPDLMGEKEAVLRSGFFMVFPQDWRNTDGQGWSCERLGLNTVKESDLMKQYNDCNWLREAVLMINQLTTEEIIRLAYDFTFGRSEPTGARRVLGCESFSQASTNTIARNFARARANNLIKNGTKCHPQGPINIEEIDNDLKEGQFSEEDCLKIGPSNNLLTYQAIHFLNTTGWRADIRSLSYLLACQYLRSVSRLKVKKKILRHAYSARRRASLEKEIEIEMERKEKLEKMTHRFVRNSTSSLVEQGAISEVSTGFVALGNEIQTCGRKITMDPYAYDVFYKAVLRRISEIHALTRQTRQVGSQVLIKPEITHIRPRVYVASTCYDLRDLRAEVARALREWGYQPYLNEDSDFPVMQGVNSYDACIEAVKRSDCMVLIMGTRYGGEIEELGISITELEYRTARDFGIPRINFCLDTVWNIVQVRKNNPQLNYPDYFQEKREKVDKIFKFLDNVRKYEITTSDNWVYPFKNSVALKEILRKQLEKTCPIVGDRV